MSAAETNAALRMAARLIRAEAARLPAREVARDQYDEHRDAPGMKRAATILDALLDPAELATAPSVMPHSCPNHAPTQHRDGKPKWCNACGRTTSGIHHDDLPRADGARPGGSRP